MAQVGAPLNVQKFKFSKYAESLLWIFHQNYIAEKSPITFRLENTFSNWKHQRTFFLKEFFSRIISSQKSQVPKKGALSLQNALFKTKTFYESEGPFDKQKSYEVADCRKNRMSFKQFLRKLSSVPQDEQKYSTSTRKGVFFTGNLKEPKIVKKNHFFQKFEFGFEI